MWTRYFATEAERGTLYKVFPCSDGFILTGHKHDTVSKYGSQDAWLVKLDKNGCLYEGCEANDMIDTLTGVDKISPQNRAQNIKLYPNPADWEIHIQPLLLNQKIELWSITGIKILEVISHAPHETISTSLLPQGLYLLKISDVSGNVLNAQKLNIIH